MKKKKNLLSLIFICLILMILFYHNASYAEGEERQSNSLDEILRITEETDDSWEEEGEEEGSWEEEGDEEEGSWEEEGGEEEGSWEEEGGEEGSWEEGDEEEGVADNSQKENIVNVVKTQEAQPKEVTGTTNSAIPHTGVEGRGIYIAISILIIIAIYTFVKIRIYQF